MQFCVVAVLGVNSPLWDEFDFAEFVRQVHDGENWLPWIWHQHNEHRNVWSKVAMAANVRWFAWDRRAEMFFTALVAASTVHALWLLYRQMGMDRALRFAPVAWLVCSLAGYETMLYGVLSAYAVTIAGAVWCFVLLSYGGWARLLGAVVAGASASCSVLNGFLVWPLGAALLLARRQWRSATVWLTAGTVTTVAYFWDFTRPRNLPPPSFRPASLVEMVSYGLQSLGAPLAGGSFVLATLLGVGVLVACGAATAWTWRKARAGDVTPVPAAAIMAFGGITSAILAVGRNTVIPSLQSRYVTFSSLAIIGLYLVALAARERRELGALATRVGLGTVLFGLVIGQVDGLIEARQWSGDRARAKFLLQTFESQPDEALGAIYSVPELRRALPWLKEAQLGPFADPRSLLLLVRWADGSASDEILPGNPVRQTFICPVQNLHDIAVCIANPNDHGPSALLVSVFANDSVVAERNFDVGRLPENGWLRLELADPISSCMGTRLALQIESLDGIAGNGASVWTFPAYYIGELHGPEGPIPERVLGLALNASRERVSL